MIDRLLILLALAMVFSGAGALALGLIDRAPGDCYFCGRPM